MSPNPKMKVEIWSDIMCPFCYIGKRHYEAALKQFPEVKNIETEWHSFQLDPTIPRQTEKTNVYQYLAKRKGISYEESEQMHENVVEMAKRAGLNYDFEKVVVANSFDAHRLIQLAKKQNLGDHAEESLFLGYFTEGLDLADPDILANLGKAIGLDEKEIRNVLTSDDFAYAVRQDIQEAENLGIRGVPFFVFDRKYGISGAQPVEVFLETLKKSFSDWRNIHTDVQPVTTEGPACSPDGSCN
jgi:predicted DsbA family dithiol-disulfide isomerase